MQKTFELNGSSLDISFGLRMDIDVIETDKQHAFVEFESDNNDLIMELNNNSLVIKSRFDEELLDEVKDINTIGGLVSLIFKKGLEKSYSAADGSAKIYIPNKDIKLRLKTT